MREMDSIPKRISPSDSKNKLLCKKMAASNDILIGDWIIDLEESLEIYRQLEPDVDPSELVDISSNLEGMVYRFREGQFEMERGCEKTSATFLGSELRGEQLYVKILYEEHDHTDDWLFEYQPDRIQFNDFWVMKRISN